MKRVKIESLLRVTPKLVLSRSLFDQESNVRDVVSLIVAIDSNKLLLLFQQSIRHTFKEIGWLICIKRGNNILDLTCLRSEYKSYWRLEHFGLLNGNGPRCEVLQVKCGLKIGVIRYAKHLLMGCSISG